MFPDSRLEQILQEQLTDDRLREFARVNWYDGYKAKISAEGIGLEDVDRVFAILRSFERMLKGI